MSEYEEKLSAFLDGELSEAESHQIEAALEKDPALQAELEALMAADQIAQDAFAAQLQDAVPLSLAAAIHSAPEQPKPANTTSAPSRSRWLAVAATLAALGIGGVTGYSTGIQQGVEVAETPRWLADIADYHRVYAGQVRHLVEVPAEEAEHIQTWLTATVGTDIVIPDLSEYGLTFQGARLLVAAGKPVSQLMFTDAQGRVVALCQIQTDSPREGFGTRVIGDFEMVSWGSGSANYVIVGDDGAADFGAMAQAVASQVDA